MALTRLILANMGAASESAPAPAGRSDGSSPAIGSPRRASPVGEPVDGRGMLLVVDQTEELILVAGGELLVASRLEVELIGTAPS